MAAVSSEPITISLSFEELQVVLRALGNPTIPGLDNDPWVGLTAELQDLALSVAWRGLAARGFARLDEDDQFRLHNAVLAAVRSCASARRTILVDRYAPDAQLSTLYAHTGDDGSVVHSGAAGVHTFVLLSSEAELVDYLASACEWSSNGSANGPIELTVPRQDFTNACDASAGGEEAQARRILTTAGGSNAASTALAHALAARPRLSIVRMLRAGQAAPTRSFTFIEGDGSGWLVAPAGEAEDAPLRAKSSARDEVVAQLRDW